MTFLDPSEKPLPAIIVWRSEDGYYAMNTTADTLDDDWNDPYLVHGPADSASEATLWAESWTVTPA